MNEFVDYSLARKVAEDVYSGKLSVPTGWEIDGSFNRTLNPDGTFSPNGELSLSSGLYVYALRPTANNTPVDPDTRILAFRGTEPTNPTDVIADLQGLGKDQFDSGSGVIDTWLAANLTQGNNIEILGHSLGGGLVQWAINDTNISAIKAVATASGQMLADAQITTQLHFTTFNAFGISLAPGATQLSDKVSVVSGEHHVIEGFAPFIHGDPIHLLGGAPVGGNVVAHIVDFRSLGQWGFGAHSIREATWWNSPIDPGYAPNYPDFQTAQTIASAFSRLGNTNGTIDSETEAAFSMYLYLLAAFPAVVGAEGTRSLSAPCVGVRAASPPDDRRPSISNMTE